MDHAPPETTTASGSSCSAFVVLIGTLVVYRLKDQQARAVTRARPDVLVGVAEPGAPGPRRQAHLHRRHRGRPAGGHLLQGVGLHPAHPRRPRRLRQGGPAPGRDRRSGAAGRAPSRPGPRSSPARRVSRWRAPRSRGSARTWRTSRRTWPRRAPSPTTTRARPQRMKTLFERGLVSATDCENARTNAESSRGQRRRPPRPSSAWPRSRSRPRRARCAWPQAQVETYRAAARHLAADQPRQHAAAGAVRRLRLAAQSRPRRRGERAVRRHQHHLGRHPRSSRTSETVKVQIEVPGA